MGSRGRLALICVVVLGSATGFSARQTASTAAVVRMPPGEASGVQTQKRDLPWESQADIRERQMLAWIILLMKDGRGAR